MTIADNYVAIITAFIVAIALFIGMFYADTLTDNLTEVDLINDSTESREVLTVSLPKATDKYDFMFIAIYITLIIVYWITNWVIGTNPIFLVINLILILVGIIASFAVSNVWDGVTNISSFAVTTASLPIMDHILSYLPLYTIIVSFVALILTFGKPALGEFQ